MTRPVGSADEVDDSMLAACASKSILYTDERGLGIRGLISPQIVLIFRYYIHEKLKAM